MKTEVMIPFTFDTDPVEQMLQQLGEEEVSKKVDILVGETVQDAVSKVVPKKKRGYYQNDEGPDWDLYMRQRFDAFLEQHVDEIVELAAMLMAAKAGRKKKYRDVLKELREQGELGTDSE